jgi:hypothetical protein
MGYDTLLRIRWYEEIPFDSNLKVSILKPIMSHIHSKTGSICPVCCDSIEDEGIVLHKTRRQTHRLCINCGISYLTPLIAQATENLRQNIRHKASIVKCPGTYHGKLRNQCHHEIDLRNIVVSDTSPLYTNIFRISYVLQCPNVFVCPERECGDIVETHPDDPVTRTQCQSCTFIWCRQCQLSPYHDDMSCIEYEASQNNTETGKLIWEKKIKGDLKFCPQCRVPTEKVRDTDGKFVACNKIVCTQCQIKWCWICEAKGIDYCHFNEKSKTRCANKLWQGTIHST